MPSNFTTPLNNNPDAARGARQVEPQQLHHRGRAAQDGPLQRQEALLGHRRHRSIQA